MAAQLCRRETPLLSGVGAAPPPGEGSPSGAAVEGENEILKKLVPVSARRIVLGRKRGSRAGERMYWRLRVLASEMRFRESLHAAARSASHASLGLSEGPAGYVGYPCEDLWPYVVINRPPRGPCAYLTCGSRAVLPWIESL